jgi:autotransporter-associated beta strand protein
MQRRKQITGRVAFRIICWMFSLCAAAEAQVDTDSDGLADSVETNTGTYVSPTNTGTNPNLSDTDGDGAGDWYEVKASFTNPLQASSKPRVPYPLPDPNTSTGATNKRVKVYIMSGQSNMVGMGTMNGTIDKSLATYTGSGKKFPDLVNASGGWTTRKDIRYRGVISDITNAELSPANLGDKFGPELGFGYVIGWFHDEPVLLLKSCTGNRSLAWDILPKTSPGYGNPTPVAQGDWYAGKEYDRFFMHESEWAHPDAAATNVVDVLDNFGTQYPAWAAQGFEIAGFVWWQGDKDRYNTNHANSYEANLVKLITQLRTYYSNRYPGKVVANAPFVLATLGQTSTTSTDPEDKAIFNAQRAVDGSTGKYPQFAGNVKTVYSHPLSEGGASNDHYQERAGTYMLVGDALGRAMVELLDQGSVWTQTAGGAQNWTTATNWEAGSIPNPTNSSTVDFSSVDLVANTTLSLGANRTAQIWKFGDTSGTQNWIFNSGNTLTLDGTTPTIEVVNNSAQLDCVVAGTAGLTKTGTGSLLLNASNTYTGITRISGGTLQAATLANGGSNSSIGASPNALGNLILNGGTLRYTGAAVSTNRLFSLQASSSIDASGTGAVNFTNTGAMGFNSSTADKTLTLTGNNIGANTLAAVIGNNTGPTSITKTGTGTWVLSGLSATAASNYSGATIIDNGTLRFITTNPSLTGNLTFGAAVGSTNPGNLDLSAASATFAGAIQARTNSINPGIITIGSGRTLQISGAFTVGYNPTALPHATTALDVTGSGTLSIGTSTTPTNANIQIANGSTTNVGNAGILDMSGLSNFYANLGTSIFRVGSPTNVGSSNGGGSTVFLASNSTIQAATLLLGSPDGSANGATAVQSLKLGSGATVINVETLNLGGIGSADGRSNGSFTFNGAAGTLKIRSQTDPLNGRPNLNIGVVNMNTGVPQTGNLFDTTGHAADLRFGTMNLGSRTLGTGPTAAQFKFDGGTLDANNLTAGSRGGTAGAAATATGTISIGGGTVTINNTSNPIQLGVNTLGSGTASGTIHISGGNVTVAANGGNSIRLGNASTVSGTANGTLNISGGTLSVAGDIIRGAATGTSNATVNLSGGTLNMNGHDLGAAGSGALTFTAESGILQNVASINGMGGLNKTSTGTLVLQGNNSYTGDTTVNDGTLTLADNALLTFVIGSTSGTNNRITGIGNLILNGDFIIDTTLTDSSALNSGSWSIVDAPTLTETYGASFSIIGAGWSESANVWTKTVGSKKYTFTEATGTLTLSSAVSYTSWLNGFFPGVSDPAIIGADKDPDKDGIANGVEMVIGGNPQLGIDTAMLPTIEVVTNPVSVPAIPAGNYLLFTYRRSDLSATAGVTAVCETNSDLSKPWTPTVGVPGVVIQVDDNYNFTPPAASPTDRVRVYVPRVAHSTQFGRLKVLVP